MVRNQRSKPENVGRVAKRKKLAPRMFFITQADGHTSRENCVEFDDTPVLTSDRRLGLSGGCTKICTWNCTGLSNAILETSEFVNILIENDIFLTESWTVEIPIHRMQVAFRAPESFHILKYHCI